MSEATKSDSGDSETVQWERVLSPHRSLSPKGFLTLMLCLGAVSFVSGIVFVSIGAWPVFGFFGLDVVLLYIGFRLNYRDGRMREILRLTGDDFVLDRVDISGQIRRWRSQAFWLQVKVIETGPESARLQLTSHGKSVLVGRFLTADEVRKLAGELRLALDAWRGAPALV